jgi:hypothetical protein
LASEDLEAGFISRGLQPPWKGKRDLLSKRTQVASTPFSTQNMFPKVFQLAQKEVEQLFILNSIYEYFFWNEGKVVGDTKIRNFMANENHLNLLSEQHELEVLAKKLEDLNPAVAKNIRKLAKVDLIKIGFEAKEESAGLRQKLV